MKTRADLTLEAHGLLQRWLEDRQRQHGGECSQTEWQDFLTMQRRTCVWNRRLMLLYCAYLRDAVKISGSIILLDRPQVYAFETTQQGENNAAS